MLILISRNSANILFPELCDTDNDGFKKRNKKLFIDMNENF